MKFSKVHLTVLLLVSLQTAFCQTSAIISKEDFSFLEKMTRDVLDSSRVKPGQNMPATFGKNNTGGTLVRPGGRDTYPAFWIRDYAMSLETGFVTTAEQKHMLLLTASTQCDQTWITRGGSMVPFGAIADHIRVNDKLPVYYPGTYDYLDQGKKEFGMFPPYDDQFYFIQMAYYYIKSTGDIKITNSDINQKKLIDRLENAFCVQPSHAENDIVFTNDAFRGVDFGFRDAVDITGDLCYASLLKYTAAIQLAELFEKLKNAQKAIRYRKIAANIKTAIPSIFRNKNGMLRASTGKSDQEDVWATALAIHLKILEGTNAEKAASYLDRAYKTGTLAYKGSIRHVLTAEDFSKTTSWESSLAGINTYQNGAYWGTPTGWVANAIALVDMASAHQLVKEYITELRENDFRKGPQFNSPMECFFTNGYSRGPVYLTTVSCPYIALKTIVLHNK
ncbi:hypothetical protein [Dyadobacter psychrotolerans]|uniref:Alpha-L-rhamnosidase six-hairpin glycosidase domain-containing protein n=1 Tax=Dyadobacter psychrotolerans TaxID=2541721 RepID=A0A4R5DK32_9BACT|nr:hypothetical protein [Dyadobacter psychrotolerans]TDE14502.1 hypothetical protein E0F88_14985 [Dyadobacter psychrotolerans]